MEHVIHAWTFGRNIVASPPACAEISATASVC